METLKILIRTDVYEQLEQKAKANNIAITDLANILLAKMLGNHHKEIKEVIEKVKSNEIKSYNEK